MVSQQATVRAARARRSDRADAGRLLPVRAGVHVEVERRERGQGDAVHGGREPTGLGERLRVGGLRCGGAVLRAGVQVEPKVLQRNEAVEAIRRRML